MQINITGHGIDVTPAIRSYTIEKFDKLKNRGSEISNINIIFDVEKVTQIAKATLHFFGTEVHARSESGDLYSAIDSLMDKINHQLIKLKEKIKNHHRE